MQQPIPLVTLLRGVHGGPGESDSGSEAGADERPQLRAIRKMLLRAIEAMELPPNPLDALVDQLGGEAAVAEMTGRRGYMKRDTDSDRVTYQERCVLLSELRVQ